MLIYAIDTVGMVGRYLFNPRFGTLNGDKAYPLVSLGNN